VQQLPSNNAEYVQQLPSNNAEYVQQLPSDNAEYVQQLPSTVLLSSLQFIIDFWTHCNPLMEQVRPESWQCMSTQERPFDDAGHQPRVLCSKARLTLSCCSASSSLFIFRNAMPQQQRNTLLLGLMLQACSKCTNASRYFSCFRWIWPSPYLRPHSTQVITRYV